MKSRVAVGGLLALMLTGCATAASDFPSIREVVAFGDSLSDCGTFGFVPTTIPARAWDQQVAQRMHYDLTPNWTGNLPGLTQGVVTQTNPADLCYAQAGARVTDGTQGKPPLSGSAQLNRYLAEHKRFTSEQLVTVYLGTNDVLGAFFPLSASGKSDAVAKTAAGEAVKRAAIQLAVLVDQILDHGAEHVAVLNLYDLGKSTYDNPSLSELTAQFNATLAALLPRDHRIIAVDTHALFDQLAANPAAFGFKNPMNDNACKDSSLFDLKCFTDPALWKSPDADKTYILIGMVHFTGRTEKLLADYVLRQVIRSEAAASPRREAGISE